MLPMRKDRRVDKEWLHKAVSLHQKEQLLDFAWGMQLPDYMFHNSSLKIEKVGNIRVPELLQVFMCF